MEVFSPANTNAIAATSTSQSRALPTGSAGSSCAYYNNGAGVVFVVTGASDVVATLPALSTNVGAQGNATPIPVGASVNLTHASHHTHWAAICIAAATADVYCTPGIGL